MGSQAFSHSRAITKVVIPVAGMGTRFLPATKAIPKELLPIIDKPIIHYIVEECVDAGVETIVFVTSRPKILIEDYFDPEDFFSLRLAHLQKKGLIEDVVELSKKINIISTRQYEARGLGHAILQAAPILGQEPFAVVLGDDIIHTKKNEASAIGQCLNTFKELERGSVVGALSVDPLEVSKYGIIDFGQNVGLDQHVVSQVKTFIEKPDVNKSPSRWALPGRYVFESGILDSLKNTTPGKNGEIQLTDAMIRLNETHPFFAQRLIGERFDTGDKLGYILANVAFALENKEYGEQLHSWLQKRLSHRSSQ